MLDSQWRYVNSFWERFTNEYLILFYIIMNE